MKQILLCLAIISLTSIAFAQKSNDFIRISTIVRDSKQKGQLNLADSISKDYIENQLFKLSESELMTKDYLSFIGENLGKTDSRSFKLFFKQPAKINAIIGNDKAEYAIRYSIARDFFPKIINEQSRDLKWDDLQNLITKKFGALGLEVIYGKRMHYYIEEKDWNNFSKYYKLYFEKALERPEYDVNGMSWILFEKVDDQKVLQFACDIVMKYALEQWYQNDPTSWDTYANLLHKIGRTDQAIPWEEKAVRMKKGQPDEKLYTDALGKMMKGLPTWDTKIN